MKRWRALGVVALLAGSAVVTAAVSPVANPQVEHYTVRQGDSWSLIVSRVCSRPSTAALATAFARAADAGTLTPGEIVHIDPTLCTTTTPTTSTTSTSVPASSSSSTTSSTSSSTTTPSTTVVPGGGFVDIPTDPGVVAGLIEPRAVTAAGTGHGEGAFRFNCLPSHLAWDDPVVAPGRPGASHLHQFFGNTGTNADSTFQSLRTTGESTCQGGVLNRSAYWTPALLNGAGQVVAPDFAVIYYKTAPEDAPTLTQLPNGLRYIAGADPTGTIPDTQLYGSPNPGVAGGFEFHPAWRCVDPAGDTRNLPGTLAGYSPTIPTCTPGDLLFSIVAFPWCTDGRTDSPNHRAHVVYPPRDPATGRTVCPPDHPLVLPKFTIQVVYTVAAGDTTGDWFLSSDRMPGMPERPAGSTLHADWFGAWDPTIIATWTQHCLREVRDSVAADFCDGTGGRQPASWVWVNPVHLSPIPPNPKG